MITPNSMPAASRHDLTSALGVQGARCILDTSFSFCFPYFYSWKFSLRIKYSIGLNGRNSFDKHEATGTILIVDSRASAEKVSVYDRTRAGKRYSPASTFKVPHTLFALDAGVVKDEFAVFPWDGVKKRLCAAQSDRTCARLCDILHSGCMKNLLRRSVRRKHGSYLSRISYGNMDPSTKGGAYWVDGKLLSLLKSRWFFKSYIKMIFRLS